MSKRKHSAYTLEFKLQIINEVTRGQKRKSTSVDNMGFPIPRYQQNKTKNNQQQQQKKDKTPRTKTSLCPDVRAPV